MDAFNYGVDVFIMSATKFLLNAGKGILILIIGFAIIKLVTPNMKKIINKITQDQIVERFAFNLLSYLLKICVILMAITAVGVQTASLVAVLGSIGFAIGLAFQGALSNFAGGILLLTQRPFSVDDFIDVSGKAGLVHSISILSTTLHTIDNKVITIPNGQIVNSSIINYSSLSTRRVDLVIPAAYTENSEKVISVIKGVVALNKDILPNNDKHENQVFLSGLKDSSVEYTIRVWVDTDKYWLVYNSLLENIKITFDRENIEIPYNKLDVNIIK